jgi:hypothetical protein
MQLPPSNRQRLLWLLSQILERRLTSRSPEREETGDDGHARDPER